MPRFCPGVKFSLPMSKLAPRQMGVRKAKTRTAGQFPRVDRPIPNISVEVPTGAQRSVGELEIAFADSIGRKDISVES